MKSREIESAVYKFKMVEIYNFNTGKVEPSDYWLSQDKEKIHTLRYSLLENKKSYGCPCCKTPVILRLGKKVTPHFAHTKRPVDLKCALCDQQNMTEQERRNQMYNQAKESEEHIHIKTFIGDMLKKDPNAHDIQIEKIQRGIATPTTYKRPDVQCIYNGKKLVFEVQISNTWLSDIVERDKFYKENGTYIIWVFNTFDSTKPNENITQADIFYNNPEINLFVLDENAEQQSIQNNFLKLQCHYREERVDLEKLTTYTTWSKTLINLSQIQYDENSKKTFYFNYQQSIENALKYIEKIKESRKKTEKKRLEIQKAIEEEQRIKREKEEKERVTRENKEKENLRIEQEKQEAKEIFEKEKKEEERKREQENIAALLPKKIEESVSKNFDDINNKDLVDLIFENKQSISLNNINNRIYDLKNIGFKLPTNILDIMIDKQLIKHLTSVTAQVQYERNNK